jgi:hypothetical protein
MRVRAESVHNGVNYSTALAASNAPTANCAAGCLNGNGIVAGDTIAQQLVTDAGAQTPNGKIFAVTNAGPTAYAIFGQLNSQPLGTYFCTDSYGRTAQNVATATPTIACSQ